MPTPIEILLDPISLTVIGMYLALFVWEKLFPRNKNLPRIPYTTLRGVLFFAIFFYLSSYLPLLTDEYLAAYQLVDLSSWSLSAQITIGLFVYQFVIYIWHRSMHSSNRLWRIFHQMHHSAEKLDIPSAFYFSPMDMIAFTLLGSIVFALMMGISPTAATVVILTLNFLSIFSTPISALRGGWAISFNDRSSMQFTTPGTYTLTTILIFRFTIFYLGHLRIRKIIKGLMGFTMEHRPE